MNAYVSNLGVLSGWLKYLEEVAKPTVGNNRNKLIKAAQKLELLNKAKSMCLDIALAGENTTGFFVKLNSKAFSGKHNSTTIETPFDNFLEVYQTTVGEPKEFSLELDTSPAEGLRAALFLEVESSNVLEVIFKILAWQGEQKRFSGLRKLLDRASQLEPVSVGFMFGQNKLPIRLCFALPQGKTEELTDYYPFVELLELGGLSGYKTIEQDLKQMTKFDFLKGRMNVDLLPLGNLNGTVSFDFYHDCYRLEQQAELLKTKEFGYFTELLQRWQVADNRLNNLNPCIFFAPINQALGEQEYLVSTMSHFTLRYNRGVRQAAKVCLEAERLKG